MDGSGTESDPYLVTNATDLDNVRNDKTAWYKQTANINLSNITNWTPIGYDDYEDPDSSFRGHYDGNNYTIDYMTIEDTGNDIGLFGYVEGDTDFININLTYIDISGGSSIGGLIGYRTYIDDANEQARIEGCSVSGLINGSYTIGGIIGYGMGYIEITDCFSNCHITAEGYADYGYFGGVAGQLDEYDSYFVIRNSTFDGEITAGEKSGGFAGFVNANARSRFINCSTTGTITANNSDADYIGGFVGHSFYTQYEGCSAAVNLEGLGSYAGGFAGELDGNDTRPPEERGEVVDCRATGYVDFTSEFGFGFGGFAGWSEYTPIRQCYANNSVTGCREAIGGFVGLLQGSEAIIESCYSIGKVEGVEVGSNTADKVGGFAGSLSSGAIEKSYCAGVVTGDTNIGGFVGNASSSSAENCYFDSEVSGISSDEFATAKTTAEMKTENTFLPEWDFKRLWAIDADKDFNDGYPFFPYYVSSAGELDSVRNDLEGYYIQTADIDLNSYSNWDPIGMTADNTEGFKGVYDGKDYNIENLTIDKSSRSDVGLFTWIDEAAEAVIKNVHLKSVDITGGSSRVGALAGGSYYRTLNCSVEEGTVTANWDRVGGLVGQGAGEFTDCYVEGVVITAGDEGLGGLVGACDYTYGSGTFKNCYADNVEVKGAYQYAGGFIGLMSGSEIRQCKSSGHVECQTERFGGFIGNVYGGDWGINIHNSYTLCSVEGIGNDPKYSVGGFIGYLDNTDGLIENCYSANWIDIEEEDDGEYGGFVGYDDAWGDPPTYDHCYYDLELVHMEDAGSGTPRTTSEMTKPYDKNKCYIGWDFDSIWYIYEDINDGYPVLQEYPPISRDIYYFLEIPNVTEKPPVANRVIVESPDASYTAEVEDISEDKIIEKRVEIDEGDVGVCETVAKELLDYWKDRKISISGPIRLVQNLDFQRKIRVKNAEAEIDDNLILQKQEHDVISQRTTISCGDIILSDDELLARILDDITNKA